MGTKHYAREGIKSGPGGLHCACCNPYKTGKLKPTLARQARRKAKQRLRDTD